MTTAAEVLHVAQAQVGYVEQGGQDGHSGNVTKFWAELDPSLQGASWCGGYVSWVYKHAGHPLPAIDRPYGFIYCPDAVIYAKQHGLWDTSGHYHPGDIIFYDWTGHGVAEHTGIVVSDDGTSIHTIEGNTSAGDAGSQANGGGVYARVRAHGATVMGVLRASAWLADQPAPAPQPHPAHTVKHNPYHAPTTSLALGCKSDHATNSTRVHWVQWAVAVPCDGVWGSQTDHAVRVFQHYHKLTVDGIVGPQTRAVLARVTH